jgi:hypothetical protein
MNKFLLYCNLLLIIGFLFYRVFLKEEINCGLRDTIDHRHHVIDSLCNELDSLHKVIDTLKWEKDIFDYNVTYNTEILSAIIAVESSNNDSAYNSYEDAVGCLQIRQTMVDDVNRILRRKKSPVRFTYQDRWDRHKSVKMFEIYCKHYDLSSYEEIARCWNGGPRGIDNPSTVGYWVKVQNYIEG